MPEIQPLSQRDPRWAHVRLGTGSQNKTTIGSHGCTITDLAMAVGMRPDDVNRLFIEHGVYAAAKNSPNVVNLVNWQRIHLALPQLKFRDNGRRYHYNTEADNNEVLAAIAQNGFCLVEVDFDGTPRSDDSHWVLYKGKQKQNDPWSGNETPTAKYSIKKGFAIIDRVGTPPAQNPGGNMPDMYNGYDISNKESMKILVDLKLRHDRGEFIDRPEYEKEKQELRDSYNNQIKSELLHQEIDVIKRLATTLQVTSEGLSIDSAIKEIEKRLNKEPKNGSGSSGSQNDELPKAFKGHEIISITLKP